MAVPRATLAAILAAAADTRDVEICGLLFGGEDGIDSAEPCANVADDPARAFEIDPAALISAYRAARTGGPRPIGHYHSHPSGAATPSATDLAASQPGQLWLIVGGGVARLWVARDGGFDEASLIEA